MFEAALGTAAAFIILFSWLGWRKVAGYPIIIDIGMFILCVYLFRGTYAGMMTGILAGLLISFFLKAIRRTMGYETLALRRFKGQLLPRPYWKLSH